MDNLFYEIVRLDSRSGLIMGDSLADARGPSGPMLAIRWFGWAVWRPGRDSNPQRARELLECRTGDSRAYSRPAPASRGPGYTTSTHSIFQEWGASPAYISWAKLPRKSWQA